MPIASVVGDWVYIDGGEFSFLVDGVPKLYYCKLSFNLVAKNAGR